VYQSGYIEQMTATLASAGSHHLHLNAQLGLQLKQTQSIVLAVAAAVWFAIENMDNEDAKVPSDAAGYPKWSHSDTA